VAITVELLFRHFWLILVIVTAVNARAWWSGVQSRILANPELEPGYRHLYRGYLFWCNVPWLLMGVGILSGQVAGVHDFLRPSEGNPFVLQWYGAMAALLCLGTYWMFFGGGAELLEAHPGVYMVPQWPAPKLRLFWLGLVAWNIGIATLLFLGFPSRSTSPSKPEFASWLWVFFPVLFVAGWLLVSFLLAALSGWQALAKHYGTAMPFTGTRFRFRSARLGGYVNYGACLTLGSGTRGLYLAVFPLFRAGHQPLLIPWSDVTAQETRTWFFSAIDLGFAKVPGSSVRFSRRLAETLFRESGNQIVIQPAA
jgi:hypothetical protein